jgi:hypothetical protein
MFDAFVGFVGADLAVCHELIPERLEREQRAAVSSWVSGNDRHTSEITRL